LALGFIDGVDGRLTGCSSTRGVGEECAKDRNKYGTGGNYYFYYFTNVESLPPKPLRSQRGEDKPTKPFPSLLSFNRVKGIEIKGNLCIELKVMAGFGE
jgi:hypothetical protein